MTLDYFKELWDTCSGSPNGDISQIERGVGGEMETHSKTIDELIQRIVEEVHPLRIILFGSAATGEVRANSDIDLLVVMPEGVHRRRIAQSLYQKIVGLGVPFDILVATPDDLQKHKNNIGLIYRTILQEGREVYAA
jgi:predicted nucleotidyltransferase